MIRLPIEPVVEERSAIDIETAFRMYQYSVTRLMPPSEDKAPNWGEEAHAILTSRSDLQEALDHAQRLRDDEASILATLDDAVRQNARLLIAAEDDYRQQRARLARPRSHWWWYLDEA